MLTFPALRETDETCPFCQQPVYPLADVAGGTLQAGPCCAAFDQAALQTAHLPGDPYEEEDRRRDFTARVTGGERPNKVASDWRVSYSLTTWRCSKTEIRGIIDEHHEHLPAPHMGILGVKCFNGPRLVGVAMLAPPTARAEMQKGRSLEANRICTFGPAFYRKNAVSVLTARLREETRRLKREALRCLDAHYAAKEREGLFAGTPHAAPLNGGARSPDLLGKKARKRSFRRAGVRMLRTYTLASESGTSLRASGWEQVGVSGGGQWNSAARDGRQERSGEVAGPKQVWETAI